MYKILLSIVVIMIMSMWTWWWWSHLHPLTQVRISDDGREIVVKNAKQGTVADILSQAGIHVDRADHVEPNQDAHVTQDTTITIARHKTFHITQKDQETTGDVLGVVTLADALHAQGISYDEDDIITPAPDTLITNGLEVRIIAVEKKDVVETVPVAFKNVTKKDSTKDVGYKEITQKGIPGKKKITYRVVMHDGQEYARHVIKEEVLKDPIDNITTIGTHKKPDPIRLGKKHTGKASWYGNKGCDCAANPWLPFGSRVKVTSVASGKSVIVTINDRGPFVAGRIIDLDKVAWKKIAPLGAGVIDVIMQEIKK